MDETNQHEHPVVVVGAGLVGTLFAIYLARRGFTVELYERRQDTRVHGNYEGRSINLAISDRGLRGLDAVGVGDEIRRNSIAMPGRFIHASNGAQYTQPYGKPGQSIRSISRQVLNEVLLNKADEFDNITITFNAKCTYVDVKKPSVTFHIENDDGSVTEKTVLASFVTGCDGAYSAVRAQLQKMERFEYAQTYLSHGYKELRIPPLPDGSWALPDFERLHIWPRKSFMLIALPNPKRDYTATVFLPFDSKAPNNFGELDTPEKVTAFFQREFPDVLPLMPTLIEDWFHNPSPAMIMVHCAKFHYHDKVLLLGDAAHAIVPFYGQGCNCGFEDCVVFDELLDKHCNAQVSATAPATQRFNLEAVFEEFTTLRKDDAKAICDLAVHNFYEMRDGSVDPWYQAKNNVIKFLHSLMPRVFIPLYTMVTFRPDIRYSEALKRAEWQDRFVTRTAKAAIAAAVAAVGYYSYSKFVEQSWKDMAAAKISSWIARVMGSKLSFN